MNDSRSSTSQECSQCGAELPVDRTHGLCPACLMAETMKLSEPKKPWEPPCAEYLAELLPQYQITRMLGRGGMGAVYQGTQKSLDRPVAIKILSDDLDSADIGFSRRFKNEARAMAKLSHPGIVSVYDSGETADGLLYIVMELVEGTDVARMIAHEQRLHSAHAMAIAAHVCDALAYAHERGIIHRDIKPANIMVSHDGLVKIADFGLAKSSQEIKSGLTQSSVALGTLYYMAPEALTMGAAVDHRADIYAVGVMLYQMLTGKLPQGLFELPSLRIPGLDPRYDDIIGKALREDRELRYPNALSMRSDLDAILTQPVVKIEAIADKSVAEQEPPPRQRPSAKGSFHPGHRGAAPAKKQNLPLLWAIALVMCMLAGWLLWSKSQQSPDLGVARQLALPPQSTSPAPVSAPTSDVAVPQPLGAAEKSGIQSNLAPGVWHDLFQNKLIDTSGLVSEPTDGDAHTTRYRATAKVRAISTPVFKDCIVRARFGGNWLGVTQLFIRRKEVGHSCYISGACFSEKAFLRNHHADGYDVFASAKVDPALFSQKSIDLEIKAVGAQYTLSCDGKVLVGGSISGYDTGSVGFFLEANATIERFEVMPLPAATDAVSVPPVTTTAVAPLPTIIKKAEAPGGQPDLAPGVWHDLFPNKLVDTSGLVSEPADGTSPATRFRAISTVRVMATPVLSNCIVRARFGGAWSEMNQLIIRCKSPKYPGISGACFNGKAFLRSHIVSSYRGFAGVTLDPAFFREKSVELELKAVDDHYSLSCNGKVLVQGDIPGYDIGTVGFVLGSDVTIERFEVMPLTSSINGHAQ